MKKLETALYSLKLYTYMLRYWINLINFDKDKMSNPVKNIMSRPDNEYTKAIGYINIARVITFGDPFVYKIKRISTL